MNYNNKLINSIEDFKSIQEKQLEQEQLKASILRLIEKAPKETQELVKAILDSSSKYINFEKLKNKLYNQDFQFETKTLINKDLLIKDIKNGTIL